MQRERFPIDATALFYSGERQSGEKKEFQEKGEQLSAIFEREV